MIIWESKLGLQWLLFVDWCTFGNQCGLFHFERELELDSNLGSKARSEFGHGRELQVEVEAGLEVEGELGFELVRVLQFSKNLGIGHLHEFRFRSASKLGLVPRGESFGDPILGLQGLLSVDCDTSRNRCGLFQFECYLAL